VQAGYYRFLPRVKGLFVGAEVIFQQMEVAAKASTEVRENQVVRIGPALGYEWLLPIKDFDRLSLTPWISQRLPLYSPKVPFSTLGENYKTADFNFVMGCNLGIRLGGGPN